MSKLVELAKVSYSDFVGLVDHYYRIGIGDELVLDPKLVTGKVKDHVDSLMKEIVTKLTESGEYGTCATIRFVWKGFEWHWYAKANVAIVLRTSDTNWVFIKTADKPLDGLEY